MVLKECLVAPDRVGTTFASRHLFGLQRPSFHVSHQARMLTVRMGRNDGASGNRRRSSNRNRQKPEIADPITGNDLWYTDAPDLEPGSSSSKSQQQQQQQGPSTSTSSQFIQRGSKGGDVRPGRPARGRGRQEEEEEEDDGRGWWERPEERSLQAFAAPSLEPWQEERLQRAYASGRRKAQIQELARELDVDRSVVIGWFKEFSLKPQSEREAILSAFRGERTVAAAAASVTTGPADSAWRRGAASGTGASDPSRPGSKSSSLPSATSSSSSSSGQEAAPTGFVPFYLRKQQGQDKQRRLKGEVLRTLEAIYDRTPFPSADVLRGLFELHRVSREVAAEWFAARRAEDGITSSTQKRSGRVSLREKDRDLQGAFSGGGDEDEEGGGLSPGAPSSGSLLTGLGASQQQPEEPTVVPLSRREMAALRSSLPSPTKHKGRQMAEKLGIKTGPGAASTQIGNVQYIEEAVVVPDTADRVRASWRYRASTAAAGGGEDNDGSELAPTSAGGRRLRLKGRERVARRGGASGAGAVKYDGEGGDLL
ncbi:hypothetical protein Vretimale_10864 [Volvox reticuliferus]|uniref:Homeobox domain-containing protein n=1 Tax=Volvox reticuliferus TaxID=1737510 RepID=A0A8J4FTN5_9CHLO|nr:hypothetical protein Vretifemale_12574 [Volvox reticuliferus]GIM06586.1 hypothetical protein Vretimale_10864 [Volvox reticuliferus]